jgi:3-oxoisoapionate decarboxylase
MPHTRRDFIGVLGTLTAGAAFSASAQAPRRRGIKLGFDHFALRALGWKAPVHLEHATTLGVDAVLLSELSVLEPYDDTSLRAVRAQADRLGLTLYVGMGSICPSSGTFNKKAGSAPDQVRQAIRVAQALGSPAIRCYLGRFDDRLTEGGIDAHVKNTVATCHAVRGDVTAAKLKLAVENHAGDMQAWELKELVEAAGPDFVGVNLDPGNAAWTLEDPVASLETLAPYVACTSIRDSAIWETPTGATVQWTAMGEGDVDFTRWVELYAQCCATVPVFIETISGLQRPLNYLTPDFWKPWPKARASDFARFLAVAQRGKPREAFRAGQGAEGRAADQAHQKAELQKSVDYCKRVLGLGVRSPIADRRSPTRPTPPA